MICLEYQVGIYWMALVYPMICGNAEGSSAVGLSSWAGVALPYTRPCSGVRVITRACILHTSRSPTLWAPSGNPPVPFLGGLCEVVWGWISFNCSLTLFLLCVWGFCVPKFLSKFCKITRHLVKSCVYTHLILKSKKPRSHSPLFHGQSSPFCIKAF